VNTGTKQQSQSTTTLEESARERWRIKRNECSGTNQNQHGVCTSGKNTISKLEINNNLEARAKKVRNGN